jgi:hypothetical protein
MIGQFITIDASGADQDTLEILGGERVPFDKALMDRVRRGEVTLPDGTSGFSDDELQLAFQEALIARTGRCVLEEEYHRAGATVLAALARSARGAGEPE